MIPAVAVAILIPVAFLYLVRRLDLYASGSFTTVICCFLWGILAFFGAYVVNTAALDTFEDVSFGLVVTLVAPIVEEILKSIILVYYVRRRDFTYFVDGAIYGFAAGTGFAVLENLFYLSNYSGGLALVLARGFSTSLMHGSASALVGVSLGRLRYGRGITRLLSVPLGWALAIGLHASYNNILAAATGSPPILLAIGIGLGGVVLTGTFIFWGLHEERQWLQETLGLSLGVSSRESAVVQHMADLDDLLDPIAERFGADKRDHVEQFIRLQAQLGLKRKSADLTPDAGLREQLLAEVASMKSEMDTLRRSVGVYCMSYVRSILPPETEPLWDRLAVTVAQEHEAKGNLWAALGGKVGSRVGSHESKVRDP